MQTHKSKLKQKSKLEKTKKTTLIKNSGYKSLFWIPIIKYIIIGKTITKDSTKIILSENIFFITVFFCQEKLL